MFLISALLLSDPGHAASVRVVGTLVQETSLSAGESAEGRVVLQNDGDRPVEVVVYPSDSRRYPAEGADAEVAVVGSNRPWLRFTPRVVTVSPGGTAEVPYRIEIPAQTNVQGTFGTHLVIEPAPTPVWPPPASPGPTPVDLGTNVSIVTHVGGS